MRDLAKRTVTVVHLGCGRTYWLPASDYELVVSQWQPVRTGLMEDAVLERETLGLGRVAFLVGDVRSVELSTPESRQVSLWLWGDPDDWEPPEEKEPWQE